jgi:hypothetical protein
VTISKEESLKYAQILLEKSWQFHNFLPQNVKKNLNFFQKAPWTMLLRNLLFKQNGKKSPQKNNKKSLLLLSSLKLFE